MQEVYVPNLQCPCPDLDEGEFPYENVYFGERVKKMDEILGKIVALRHRLHQHPELSGQETWTKQELIRFLRTETNLKIVDRGKWFYVHYRPKKEGTPSIAFRADFDALAINEERNLPYHSLNPGISHRCGHDGHSAALAGLALMLEKYGADKNVYLIFQHAEEIGGGGAACAELIPDKNISQVYAFHNWSGFPEGAVVLKNGIVQCASKGLIVRFQGKSAHASQPEDGINPSKALAELILEIQKTEEAKDYDGLAMATIVHVAAGSKNFGIAASTGEISITLRAYYDRDMEKMEKRIRSQADQFAVRDGLAVLYEESDVFPETVNDAGCIEKVRCAAEKAGVEAIDMEKPFRASEDFGYYLKKCPGAMIYIGNGADYPQIHTEKYDFNDKILKTAIELFWQLILGT